MSAGDDKLVSMASDGERTEQLGRSLTDCAMLRDAVATVQYSINVFMLTRIHDLPFDSQQSFQRSNSNNHLGRILNKRPMQKGILKQRIAKVLEMSVQLT